MTFQHFILTRFNLPLTNVSGEGKPMTDVCSDSYLDYRFSLFERFCFPSVKGQSCQQFKWLVLFDKHTPEKYQQRAFRLHEAYKNFIPCFLDYDGVKEVPQSYHLLCKTYRQKIGKEKATDIEGDDELRLKTPLLLLREMKLCSEAVPDYYLTTRIDSDDAFHKNMVSTIQKHFRNHPSQQVLDFVYSYKFILNEGIAYRFPLLNGHFLTYAEPASGPFQSVLFWNHLYIEQFLPVKHIWEKPLQTELIHGGNVVNDFTELTVSGLLYGLLHFHKHDYGYTALELSYKRAFHILAFLIKEKIRCYRN